VLRTSQAICGIIVGLCFSVCPRYTSFTYPLPYLGFKSSAWACLTGIEVTDTGYDSMVSLLALTICNDAREHSGYCIGRTFKLVVFKAVEVLGTNLASVCTPSLIELKIAR
tara:strand:- start:11712 stop:12044 length:333 start_codon:yes stop_codon:yes gene_type:complete